jgi:rapamycin-insensitive companion of mTOR
LPQLFAPALDFQNEPIRQFTREKLVKIFKSHLEAISGLKILKTITSHPNDDWELDPLGLNQDDVRFRQAVMDSEVLGLKDYTKWNWDAISDLMKGSLLNPKRFDELVRNTKFAQRLVQFIRPSSKQFSETPQDSLSSKIVWACSKFIYTMCSSVAGYRFLLETRLIAEIVDRIAKICDPGSFDAFTKDRIDTVLAKEYFTILGDMQRHPDAERIFEEHSIWNVYYLLVELRGKDFILKYILTTGNYE